MRRILVTLAAAGLLTLAMPFGALADDIENDLDNSADAALEAISLRVSDPPQSVTFRARPRNGDGRNGCNLDTQGSQLVVGVTSSDPSIATASPSSVTFTSCVSGPTIQVDGVNPGSATITLSQTSSSGQGSFTFGNASFTVNVTADPTAAPVAAPTATAVVAGSVPPGVPPGPPSGGVVPPGGFPGGPNPASTPELGSLVLFGSGAAGLAGYALVRWRGRRRD